MSRHEQDWSDEDWDVRDSTPGSTGPARAAGGMGVSSERVGHAGPGQFATDGVKDTSPAPPTSEEPPAGHQSGGTDAGDHFRASGEPQPQGLEPKAGYPSLDPRSKRKPYKDAE